MRYWHPFPAETVPALIADGAQQFAIVPMYPQFSWATNGSTIDFVLDSIPAEMPVHVIADWHVLPGYLAALAQPVLKTLSVWADEKRDPSQCALMYVAHSLPERFVKKGDPYQDRTEATVDAVHSLVLRAMADTGHESWLSDLLCGGAQPHLAYQSKVGPIAWLGPEAVDEAQRLAQQGARNLCLQPVSFTCEHIETELELDVDLRALAVAAGVVDFQRGAALNMDAGWLGGLADLVMHKAFAEKARSLDGNS